MHPILIKLNLPLIGAFNIPTYGFFVATAIITGIMAGNYWAVKYEGYEEDKIASASFWIILWGVIGAKLFFIVFEDWNEFVVHPISSFFSRQGFVIYGAIIGGAISAYFIFRRYKMSFLKVADSFVPALAMGIGIGRLGCWSAGCCYGMPTGGRCGAIFPLSAFVYRLGDMSSGVRVPVPPFTPVVPTQLLHSIANFTVFFILWRVFLKNKKFDGQVFTMFFILYGTFRFLIEFLRIDTPHTFLFGMSAAQMTGFFLVPISAVGYFYLKARTGVKR